MRHAVRILLLGALFSALTLLGACNDDPDVDTSRDTAADPLGDIAAVGSTIYATNHDESGHAGPQVDLLAFSLDGLPAATPTSLDLNGHGYLAMTDTGQRLLLQAHGTGRVFAVSYAGALLGQWQDTELADAGWRACGIGRRPGADEVVALYTRDDRSFLARTYSLDLAQVVATVGPVAWGGFPDGIFPRSLDHDGTRWLVLAADDAGANLTITLDDDFRPLGDPTVEDDAVTGLTVAGGWLYAAYADGTIAPLRTVGTR